jgi:hypothetical protein
MAETDPATAFVLQVIASLDEEDYVFSVDAVGIGWDVYRFTDSGRRGTIAFCMIEGRVEIGVCSRGELTAEEVVALLKQDVN